MHGLVIDNGVRTVDERGPLTGCGRPGRALREFSA